MVGWHLLALLCIEIVAYGAVGLWMDAFARWSAVASISLSIAIYLAVRLILIGLEFVLTRMNGERIPPPLRVSASRLIGMYFSEVALWIALFSFVMPFFFARRSVIGRRAEFTRRQHSMLPVLLVHGLACNRGNWLWLKPRLRSAGVTVFAMDYTPWFSTIDAYAPQLEAAVNEVLAATGANQLVIVAHSMGGLVTRAYLDRFGDAKVAHVVTLGTPHLGTWMTRFGFTPNVRNMALDSAWLAALREREAARSADPYGQFSCIFTYHDNLVTPQHTAVLPGSRAIALSGIGHVRLAFSTLVLTHILTIWRETSVAKDQRAARIN